MRDLARAQVALGDGVKRVMPSEKAPLFKLGKKLVAARDLPANHALTRDDLAIKSPGDGVPPYHLDDVVGRSTAQALKADEDISFDNLRDSHRS